MRICRCYCILRSPQDTEWHAEHNVHIHMGRVLNELYQLLKTEAQHIQGKAMALLVLEEFRELCPSYEVWEYSSTLTRIRPVDFSFSLNPASPR